ncbi:MAG: 3'-5' exonuclease [Clostridia bacterium]
MKYLFFDLETTSIYPNAEILEFGYLIVDENFKCTSMQDIFCMPLREVPAGATAVNGLTRAKLQFLSDGAEFFQRADYIREVMSQPDIIVCGYNSTAYDLRVLAHNLVNAGTEPVDIAKHIDLLPTIRQAKLGLKNNQLGTVYRNALHLMNITPAASQNIFKDWCSQFQITSNASLHGALFDSYVTAFCMFAYTINGVKFE